MNAPARGLRLAAAGRKVSPLDALTARAEARAALWANNAISLHEAIDQLWHDAEASGLAAELGTDRLQELLANIFAPVRDDLVSDRNDVDFDENGGDEYEGLSTTFAKLCREADERVRARQAQQRSHPKEPYAAVNTQSRGALGFP
jgi:hypothetical protein